MTERKKGVGDEKVGGARRLRAHTREKGGKGKVSHQSCRTKRWSHAMGKKNMRLTQHGCNRTPSEGQPYKISIKGGISGTYKKTVSGVYGGNQKKQIINEIGRRSTRVRNHGESASTRRPKRGEVVSCAPDNLSASKKREVKTREVSTLTAGFQDKGESEKGYSAGTKTDARDTPKKRKGAPPGTNLRRGRMGNTWRTKERMHVGGNFRVEKPWAIFVKAVGSNKKPVSRKRGRHGGYCIVLVIPKR